MKRREYRWNKWNINHIGQHNISEKMAEFVVDRYPARRTFDDRFIVKGQTIGGLFIQVVFVIGGDGLIYVIHARPLNESEKRNFRKGK